MSGFKINPSMSLTVAWGVRLAGQPYRRFRMDLPHDVEVVRWLLERLGQECNGQVSEVDAGTSSSVLETARRKGLIVTPETEPGEAEPFGCDLDPSLLHLVPPEALSAAAETIAGGDELVLAPSRVQQVSDALPDALEGRVVVDGSLRSRTLSSNAIGNFVRAPLAGLPLGLRPLRDSSRLWVRHSVTEIFQPYELNREVEALLARIAEGALRPRSLPSRLLTALVLAQILVPLRRGAADELRQPVVEMREQLAAHGYVVLRDVVSPLMVAALRRHYRALERAGFLETDVAQVRNQRDGIYCEFAALYLQDQLGRLLDQIVPHPIKPSYCWFFRYRPTAVLRRHVDRPQNQWNVSLAVDANSDTGRGGAWPLCLEPRDRCVAVRLGVGDAVLYSGVQTPHWRDELAEGHTVSMCLLEYVDRDFVGLLG